MIAAHAVHTATRWSGGGADIHIGTGNVVRVEQACRTPKQLANILPSAIDITADISGIIAFHSLGIHAVHINNAVTKARSKTLDLVQNDFAHIPGRAVRHVAVSPAGVFTVRGAAVIKEAL